MGNTDSRPFSSIGRSSMRRVRVRVSGGNERWKSMAGIVKPKEKLQLDRYWIESMSDHLSLPSSPIAR